MKVISLLQPWATLVVIGAKKIETRSWNTKYRGPLLIHASLGKKSAKELCSSPGVDPFNQFIRHWTDLPFGAIIGQVHLESTFKTEDADVFFYENDSFYGGHASVWDKNVKKEKAFGDYSEGRYGWELLEPVKFNIPVSAKGQLGIWETDIADFIIS